MPKETLEEVLENRGGGDRNQTPVERGGVNQGGRHARFYEGGKKTLHKDANLGGSRTRPVSENSWGGKELGRRGKRG